MQKRLVRMNRTGVISPDLTGCITGLTGYVTNVTGDLHDCAITDDERAAGVDIETLVAAEDGTN